MALQLYTIRHSFANKYLGPCCVSMVTNTQYMNWWYHETSSHVKQWPHNLHEHMLVWDWVWGIQHWQKSLSLALSQVSVMSTLQSCQVYYLLIHQWVWPKVSYENLREIVSCRTEVQLPPLKPASSSAAVILMPISGILTIHMAKLQLHVNGSATPSERLFNFNLPN